MHDNESAIERVITAAEDRGLIINTLPSGYKIQCPSHNDRDPSLSVTEAAGRALLHCHAGCRTADVLDGLGLTYRDLFDGSAPRLITGTLVCEYIYRAPEGYEIGAVQRFETDGGGKQFRPLRPTEDDEWTVGASDELKRTPYRANEIRSAIAAGRPIYVVEGERDVDTAWSAGLAATCNQGGAGKWTDAHAEHLRGADVVIVPDQDKAGRTHAEKVHKSLKGIARSVRSLAPAEGCKDFTDHVRAGYGVVELREVEETPEAGAGVLISLSDVVAEARSWVWPGRLPAGKLVTLDGDPSMGKSTLAVTFAAHLSTGKPWPDGACCEAGDVVIMSAEDGMADTIRPRLDAAGGDPSRVHMLTAITVEGDDGQVTTRPPTLGDIAAIRSVIRRTSARLLIVDVLMAYMPGKVDSHRDQDVRTVLHRVAEIADQTGCTVLLLRHLNKSSGGSAMYRGGGSIGIVGAARAGYLVAPDPDSDGAAVLACVKSNLAQMPESLTYRLESAPDSDVARVVWSGVSAHGAADLLNSGGEDDGDDRREIDKWLDDLLLTKGTAVPANDVFRAAAAAGYSRDQIKRAKKRLKIVTRKSGPYAGDPWVWVHTEGSTKEVKGAALRTPLPTPPCVLPSDGVEVCTRCRRPSDHPLINGRCRRCAYPSGTESPYRQEAS